MKKVYLLCLLLGIVITFFTIIEAKRIYVYETYPGQPNLNVQITDPRPLIVYGLGENASATTHVIGKNYQDYFSMESMGEFNFTQLVGHEGVELNISGKNGQAVAEMVTETYKNFVLLESLGVVDLTQLADLSNVEVNVEGKKGSAQVETMTEKYRNQGSVNSEGGIKLTGKASQGTLRLHIQGKYGSAQTMTTTEKMKNGGSINSLGSLSVSTVLSNPGIHLEIDGKKGNAAVQALSDRLYSKELNVNSLGDLSLSQLAERHQVFLHLDWTRGDVTTKTSTPNQETTVVLEDSKGKFHEELKVEEVENEKKSDPETQTVKKTTKNSDPATSNTGENIPNNGTSEQDSSEETVTAKAQLYSEIGGKIIIEKMNPRGNGPVPSDAEIVSSRLGMRVQEAKNYIRTNGGMNKINYAWEKANSYNPKPPEPKVVGRAGGMNGSSSINVQTLSPPTVYKLHLMGPKYKGFLRNSNLYMRLYYPTNGQRIKGIYTTITVAEPEPSNDILLVKEFPYDHQEDYYTYSFDKEDWLVDFDDLIGPYVLMIDAGQSLNTKLGITITKDGRIIPRNGKN